MSLLSAVPSGQLQAARIVTGVTMALFIAAGQVPALRRHAGWIRLALLAAYLLACGLFVVRALLP